MNRFNLKNTVLFILIIILAVILRILWLDRIPPALYTDEADQGYNAYSILLTGRDEHGVLFPVSLRSFGDWKPPLPAFFMTPFIFLFGLTEWSVRIPSVIFGIGTIILTYFMIIEIFNRRPAKQSLALLASFFLSISPWHIFQSRVAMLVICGLFFLELGIYCFIKSINNRKLLFLSVTSFILSIYSYYGLRLIVPLILIVLSLLYWREIKMKISQIIACFFIVLILLTPLIINFVKEPDVIFGRAKTVSVFYDQGINLRKWELITQDGLKASPIITRLFHNNLYMYGTNIIRRFLSHFDGHFLFAAGDQANPFKIPSMGLLYIVDLIFIVSGAIILIKEKNQKNTLIFYWLAISILPASFTFMTPSSNRIFDAIVPYTVLIAFGVMFIIRITKHKLIFSSLLTLSYSICLLYFLNQYFIVLPVKHAEWWSFQWSESGKYISQIQKKYDNIVVLDENNMAYIYLLFYDRYNPEKFQKEAIKTYVADSAGFEHVEGYGKYIFYHDYSWEDIKDNFPPKTLFIVPFAQAANDSSYIKLISYPDNRAAIKIFEK